MMEIPVPVSPGDSQAVCYTAALPQNSALATRQTSKWVLLAEPSSWPPYFALLFLSHGTGYLPWAV